VKCAARVLKRKRTRGCGGRYMRYSATEKYKIMQLVHQQGSGYIPPVCWAVGHNQIKLTPSKSVEAPELY